MSLKDVPNPKVMRKRMYIGGVISRHKKNFTLSWFEGFVGCVKNFKVDDNEVDLMAENSTRDVITCATSRDVAYVHGGGFATFGNGCDKKKHKKSSGDSKKF